MLSSFIWRFCFPLFWTLFLGMSASTVVGSSQAARGAAKDQARTTLSLGSSLNGALPLPIVTLRTALYASHFKEVAVIFTQYRVPDTSRLYKEFYCAYGNSSNDTVHKAKVVQHDQGPKAHDYTVPGVDTILYCPCEGFTPGLQIHVFTQNEVASSDLVFSLEVEMPSQELQGKLVICLKEQYSPRRLGGKLEKYDPIGSEAFISWMELAKILKVDHVVLYNHSLRPALTPVINMYQEEGMLTLHQFQPDPKLPNEKPSRYTGVWDCAIRYAQQYKYMMNVDTDEMIVPANHDDLISQLGRLRKTEVHRFSNTIFYTPDDCGNLTMPQVWLNVSLGRTAKYDPKYILTLPSRCRYLDPHRCRTKGVKSVDVPPNIAKSHHFKNCRMARQNNNDCNTPMNSMSQNFIVSRENISAEWLSNFEVMRSRNLNL